MRVSFYGQDGLTTRYLHEGTGSPLLLIHGAGTMAERWFRNIDVLARDFAVYAPDLLGSGFSSNVSFEGEPPQEAHLRQLEQLIDALGIDRLAVAGNSYGGLIAALLQQRNPERVTKLVIIGSGSAFHPPEQQRGVLEAAKKSAMIALADGTLAGCRARMQRTVFDPATVPEETLPMQLTANAIPGRREAMVQMYDGLIAATEIPEVQIYHRLEAISAPTLIISGRNDVRASWERAEEARTRIPDAKLLLFEQCGHSPMSEHPDRFNHALREFLG